MGDLSLNCPLCCDKTFSSKQSLVEHLSKIGNSIICPICNNKSPSLVHLIEHLSHDICQPGNTFNANIVLEDGNQIENHAKSSAINENHIDSASHSHPVLNYSVVQNYDSQIVSTDVNKMYVELVSKHPGLQTPELKLVKENGGKERYVFVSPENSMLNKDIAVVTKQNNDGTISLTAVEDMKTEANGLFSTKDVSEETQEEIYSCNTCKVSFSSVIDHIQNYHNDQDVVVEEPMEDEILPSEYDTLDEDPLSVGDKHTARRVITDTGDIIEESMIFKPVFQENDQSIESGDIVKDTDGRVYARRYVQTNKLCNSIVKPIEQDESNVTFHKVVVREVQGEDSEMEKLYTCMSCKIIATTLDHFESQPCKKLKYPCPHPQCPVAYENSKSLCAHMKVHKSKTVGISKPRALYECEICLTVFPTNKSLKLHKRMHDPIKARPIEPPLVNIDGSEGSEDRYLCSVCDKMIPIDYKDIHVNSHKTSNKMNCSICNKKFSSSEYLEMHMNVHNTDKVTVNNQDKSLPYSCIYCDRRFARPHEKVKHERIHTGEKPHSCEICGKSFRVSYCLTLHMRTHTGARPYACPHCGKRFKAHSVYNHHLLTHSDVRAYKCPYCPKAFKTAVQLAGHRNSHTKPFSCQHCNRPFASLYAVRVHTETHARQNNLKFSCAMCGASYARAFALKDHVKQVHKQDIHSVDNLANQEEDWIIKDEIMKEAETDGIQELNKDLQNEISDLGMNTNELIVP